MSGAATIVDAEGSIIAAVATASGVGLTKLFDYLKLRRREASGDRRTTEAGWGKLISRLEKRLDLTEQKADDADKRVNECEARHADCERTVMGLAMELNETRMALNETRKQVGMPPVALP